MFEIINNYNKKIEEEEILKDYITKITKELKIEDAIFNIILVDEKEIHKLNKTYRRVDKPTDVISFALEDGDTYNNPYIRMLGDIYICIPIAYEQAQIYGHSKVREVCFLATHGILHLLGYDHMTESDEKIMFKKQEELLNLYEIKR